MDPALGPPAEMVEKRDELTPMMAQYHDLCTRYDDALVLFQVGDFYETFCEAAEMTARLLEITLTSREDSTGEYPMTGIPVDNAASYVERLLEAGYRVAIADQIEEPGDSPGVVERAVTRVITPGTITEDELLSSPDNNFVAALARGRGVGTAPESNGASNASPESATNRESIALALLDVSTGDFLVTSSSRSESITDELSRFSPVEVIVDFDISDVDLPDGCTVSPFDPAAFERARARRSLEAYVGDPETALAVDAEIRASGALLAYAEYARGGLDSEDRTVADEGGDDTNVDAEDATSVVEIDERVGDNPSRDVDRPDDPVARGHLEYIGRLERYDPREYLLLDAVALQSLELFEPRSVRGREDATLAGVLDSTASALGSRRLKDWIRRPVLDPQVIEDRLDAVEELSRDVRTRETLQALLRDVYDLERLIGRISRGRANARDLRSLGETLAVVPDVRAELADTECARLRDLRSRLDPLEDVRDLVESNIVDHPPIEITEGGVIAEGYDDGLDDLRATARDGKRWIDRLEQRERERTGIESLKVGYNAVHGYYIEVTNPNLDAVPENYQRRQTLKRAERFITPELAEREDEIIRSEDRADEREYELFREIRSDVAGEVERVQALADALASLDAHVSLATVAAEYDYCRPEILDPDGSQEAASDEQERDDNGNVTDVVGPRLEIEGGRHPVVERTQESFVPNDARLGRGRHLAVITGPNMSGKSTYMRQVALILLLAQIGSFVPATATRLTPLHRIFTRVGASDDIAGGRSTFMVEMEELATILEEADERSLVLLDEVGRGTSTADGFAIARAITEHLHDEVGALTLFATHHHPLTELAADLECGFTLHFDAREVDDEVVFDHEIAPGAAEGSYGVEVARAAGVPDHVVRRSRELLDASTTSETGTDQRSELPRLGASADGGDDPTDVVAALRALDLAHLTPVEALTELDRLKRLLEER